MVGFCFGILDLLQLTVDVVLVCEEEKKQLFKLRQPCEGLQLVYEGRQLLYDRKWFESLQESGNYSQQISMRWQLVDGYDPRLSLSMVLVSAVAYDSSDEPEECLKNSLPSDKF